MANVTRRAFMELTTGMLVSLPTLAGGLVLAPRPAHAESNPSPDPTDDLELAGAESEYVVIDVVMPWEIGFMVVDVTKGTANDAGMVSYPAVVHAKVTVTSRFNGAVAEGTTDDDGVVNLDVRKLAVCGEGEDPNSLDEYYFNGSVTVECDGYRMFRTALVAVEGGSGLQVPTHPIDSSSDPYPHLISFDEWDALYSANEFSVTPANTEEHVIDVELFGLPEEGATTIELWVKGEKNARQSAQATAGEPVEVGVLVEQVVERYDVQEVKPISTDIRVPNHTDNAKTVYKIVRPVYGTKRTPVQGRPATATFKGAFLKEGDAQAFPVGSSLELVVTQKGHDPWHIPLAVGFSKGIVDEPAGKDGQTLSLINTQKGGSTGVGVSWPSNAPIIGGGDLKFWSPQLPINVYVNPFGLVQITLESPSWGYRNDKGDGDQSGWGKYPHKSVKDQWAKKVKTMRQMSDKTAALVSKPGAFQNIDLFKSFSVAVNFRLLALAQWDAEKGLFQGEVAGQILAAMNFTITENFFAGPIPVLITFALDASLVFALSAAAYSTKKSEDEAMLDAIFDFGRWQFDYENTGFTMTFNITPSLSVGVGIRGVASISVKGAITLTLFFGVPMGTQPKDLPSPHFSAGWSAQVTLVVELFLFTQSFSLYSKKFANFYDNWDGKNLTSQAEDEAMHALASMTLEELMAGLVPITDDMLRATSEASLEAQGLSAQAEGKRYAFGWNDATVTERVDEETGTAYFVYTWGTGSQVSEGGPAPEAEVEPQPEEGPQLEEAPASEAEPLPETEPESEEPASSEAVLLALAEERPMPEAETESQPQPQPQEPPTSEVTPASTDAAPEMGAPSNDELLAQAEEEPEPSYGPMGPAVTWLSAMADTSLPEPGIAALGKEGGVRPSSDVRILGSDDKHVFGAARAKVISLGINEKTGEDGGVWVFRIASVEVGGQMRTRIVGNCLDGPRKGASRVVEFDTSPTGISHDELYDYDFDVVGGYDHFVDDTSSEWYWGSERSCFYLQFAVVSGRRADPQSPTFAESATDLVFTNVFFVDKLSFSYDENQPADVMDALKDYVARIEAAKNFYSGHEFFDQGSMPLSITAVGEQVLHQDTDKFHSIISVQTQRCVGNTSWPHDPFIFTTTYLDRCADTAEGTLSDSVVVRLGTTVSEWKLFDEPGPHAWTLDSDSTAAASLIQDPTTYEQTLTLYKRYATQERHGSGFAYNTVFYFLIMLRGGNTVHYRSMRVVTSDTFDPYMQIVSLGDYDPSIRFVPCLAQGCFLTSYPTDEAQLDLAPDQRDYSAWTLHKVTVATEKYDAFTRHDAHLEFAPFGPSGFDVVNFAVNPKGTFLFWPHSRDADADRVWDVEGKESVQERAAIYQIMACRMWGDHFSDPFILADLSNDTDALAVVDANQNAVAEMLRTVYQDTGERNDEDNPIYHAADLWYTAVPAVRCVTATACEAPSPFVTPGDTIDFHVAVRNDGNTFLSGCTLELCALNEEATGYERVPGASAQVTFGEDTILESTYNRRDADGNLMGLEPDYALAPGKTSVYAVTVKVPDDWASGEKKVLFVANGGVLAAELTGQAEGDSVDANAVEFHVEPGEYQVVKVRTHAEQNTDRRYMDTITVDARYAGGHRFQPAHVTQEGGDAQNGGVQNGGGKRSQGRAVLPKMGDERGADGIGLAGAGLAALGAVVAAYERRRAENEAQCETEE